MGASFCLKCKDKTCLKTKKPCEKVEAFLRSSGIYDADYIRPQMHQKKNNKRRSIIREIPFSSLCTNQKKNMGLDGFLYANEINE